MAQSCNLFLLLAVVSTPSALGRSEDVCSDGGCALPGTGAACCGGLADPSEADFEDEFLHADLLQVGMKVERRDPIVAAAFSAAAAVGSLEAKAGERQQLPNLGGLGDVLGSVAGTVAGAVGNATEEVLIATEEALIESALNATLGKLADDASELNDVARAARDSILEKVGSNTTSVTEKVAGVAATLAQAVNRVLTGWANATAAFELLQKTVRAALQAAGQDDAADAVQEKLGGLMDRAEQVRTTLQDLSADVSSLTQSAVSGAIVQASWAVDAFADSLLAALQSLVDQVAQALNVSPSVFDPALQMVGAIADGMKNFMRELGRGVTEAFSSPAMQPAM